MKVIKVKDYDELSKLASDMIVELVNRKPDAVLGLATGGTPVGMYKELIKSYQDKQVSFSNVKTFNLDEYCDLPQEHSESYYTFMFNNLFNYVDIKKDNINMPSAAGEDLEKLSEEFNNKLKANQIDLQILGIGGNGHIGFNEPGTSFDQETFVVELAEKTRQDNARFFDSIDDVPTHAITMGIKNIMDAKLIVLLASGESKQEAVQKLVEGPVTENFPASILQKHDNVIVILDEGASRLLKK